MFLQEHISILYSCMTIPLRRRVNVPAGTLDAFCTQIHRMHKQMVIAFPLLRGLFCL
jgi:hypothetical protein